MKVDVFVYLFIRAICFKIAVFVLLFDHTAVELTP